MSESYSSWDAYGMQQGSMYRYSREGRSIYSEKVIYNQDYHYVGFDYVIGEVDKDDIVVYLDRIVAETKFESLGHSSESNTRIVTSLIKVLTKDGVIGWVYWNVGDWEKVNQ